MYFMHFSNNEYAFFLLVWLLLWYQNCDCIFYHMLYFIMLSQKWLNKDDQSYQQGILPICRTLGQYHQRHLQARWIHNLSRYHICMSKWRWFTHHGNIGTLLFDAFIFLQELPGGYISNSMVTQRTMKIMFVELFTLSIHVTRVCDSMWTFEMDIQSKVVLLW